MSSLPDGTVTFVFTDIAGSTRLLQRLGDRYAGVARDHRRLIREALGGAGGTEIDTQGDAFFFSFARARDAARGAVAARISAAGHGGQILVSETTRTLLGNALPEGVTVHDHG